MVVRDFMTTDVITIGLDNSIIEAAQILFEHNFDGLPVVDANRTLVGIITQYDLVSKGANIHLPTFIQLMKNIPLYKKDKGLIKPGLRRIVSLKVKDIMNPEPLIVYPDQPLEEVARLFSEHHRVNPIPVVEKNNRLAGIISRYDIIRLYTGTMTTAITLSGENSSDRKIDMFVKQFGRNFMFVSRFRTRYWLLASIMFAIVGFIIAMLFIIRFQIK